MFDEAVALEDLPLDEILRIHAMTEEIIKKRRAQFIKEIREKIKHEAELLSMSYDDVLQYLIKNARKKQKR